MSAETEPARLYDRVTAAWRYLLGEDFHYGWFATPADPLPTATEGLTRHMADAGALGPGQRVLDVGCGTGMPAVWLARNRGCGVTGITLSGEGLDAARARAAREGLSDRLRFELRDGQDNGFPDVSFDRAWVMESSHLMPEKDRLLAECARVLVPGGRLVLCDVIRRRPLPLREVLRHARAFDTLHRVFGRARMETLDDYAGWATAAGLHDVAVEDLTQATRPTFARWRENAATFAREVEDLVGPQYLADFVASCDVLDGFWADGTLGYGLLAANRP